MTVNRREFLTEGAGGVAAAAACATIWVDPAEARGNKTVPVDAIGLLYDSTLCIGCKACMAACKTTNALPVEDNLGQKLWDTPFELSGKTFTVIKLYKDGTCENKDREKDGFAHIKRQCLHCIDPSCVSVCPVSAMKKDPATGVVSYNADACIGCRYCVAACPYHVPQFQYDTPTPQIAKCQFCKEELSKGDIPSCAKVCPTGATLFGSYKALTGEIERRKAMTPGDKNVFPRRTVDSGDTHERAAAEYTPEVYGAKMLGGTQVRYLSGVSFAKLGMPTGLPELSYAAVSESLQHRLYGGLIAPAVALVGLVGAAYRGAKEHHEDEAPHRPRARMSAPVGGKLMGTFTTVLGVFAAIAVFFLVRRFSEGLGAVTNISNGYPWGIWVVWDVVIATGFACGGYAMALVVYILNKGEFHPLVRPALTASVFGYSLGAASVLIDLGRYWNFWHTLSPAYFNPNSVMFEVAACISLYILVLWIEFFPTFLEWLGRHSMQRSFNRIVFLFIGLGVLLPSMHQSSLGSLLIAMGYQVHPLWQTQMLPALFLLTALCMGFAVVILEATLAAVGFGRDIFDDLDLLSKIGRIISGILFIYIGLRFGDLAWRGELPRVFDSGYLSVMFWIEIALFAYPAITLAIPARRRRLSKLFPAAASMLAGAVLYRIDAFLVAYQRDAAWHYFPSAPEILVTLGVISIEVLAYVFFVKIFPILPGQPASRIR
jgi:Ni/Fe-hydrogenase subunit HybB-like protein/Fe-S-cluster-containing dehydrogenase component